VTEVRHPNGAPALDAWGYPLDSRGERVSTGPRSVPDVAGRDVTGAPGSTLATRGSLHAHRSEPGYHEVTQPLGDVLRGLWTRWASFRDRHGA